MQAAAQNPTSKKKPTNQPTKQKQTNKQTNKTIMKRRKEETLAA